MAKIVVVLGHPDPSEDRLCRALAKAYVNGATAANHDVEFIDVAKLDFPLLRTQESWQQGEEETPESLKAAQQACVDAGHIVFIYPLWLGTLPALLKGFLEQTFRPGVAIAYGEGLPTALFKGKSARVVITMGMPAFAYRWYFFAHSLRSLERNVLRFVGMSPIHSTIFGSVEAVSAEHRKKWMEEMTSLGRQAR